MRFVLSDESLNSYGFRVMTSGIDLKRFKNNPAMFYNHNTRVLPIGRWDDIRIEEDKLTAEAVFDEGDSFALEVKRKVEKEMLRGTSIGISVLETSADPDKMLPGQDRSTVIKAELFEASITPYPSNKNALKLSFNNKIVSLNPDTNIEDWEGIIPKVTNNDFFDMNIKELAIALNMDEQSNYTQIVMEIQKVQNENKSLKTELETVKAEKRLDFLKAVEEGQINFKDLISRGKRGLGANPDKSNWTLNDYRKYAPQELEKDKALLESLYEKEFGK